MEGQKYKNVVHGLKQEFTGRLLQMLCVILPMPMYLMMFLLSSDIFLLPCMYFCYFGRILFPLVCAVGLYKAGKDISACKKATVLCLADTVILVFRFFLQPGGIEDFNLIIAAAMYDMNWRLDGFVIWIDKLAAIAHCVVMFLSILLVSTSIAKVLKELGAEKLAKGSKLVWWMQLAAGVIYLLNVFFPYGVFGDLNNMAVFFSSVFYLRFLYRSYRFLGTQDK